jgi:hypothetical protein
MGRKKRNLALVLAAVLVAAVAACSGPQSLGHDALGNDPAARLLSSSFRLSAGSIIVSGEILGIPGGSTTVQAVAHGGYEVRCTKREDWKQGGNDEPQGQFKVADSEKTGVLQASRGAVRLGVEKKNQTDWRLFAPDPEDPTDACPNPDKWVGEWTNTEKKIIDEKEVVVPIWIIEDVFLRFSVGSDWTVYSWTCPTPQPYSNIKMCGQGDGMPDAVANDDFDEWDVLFPVTPA